MIGLINTNQSEAGNKRLIKDSFDNKHKVSKQKQEIQNKKTIIISNQLY